MGPTCYEIRVSGQLGESLLGVFEGVQATVEPSATVLRGALDQAALHGLISRVQALGLELIEVRRIP